MANKTNQGKRILDYLEQFGSITTYEAFTDLGITKLTTRISELRASGVKFNVDTQKVKNRYGDTVTFNRYSLARE